MVSRSECMLGPSRGDHKGRPCTPRFMHGDHTVASLSTGRSRGGRWTPSSRHAHQRCSTSSTACVPTCSCPHLLAICAVPLRLIHHPTMTNREDRKLPRRARGEIEDTGTEIIFHHLHEASGSGRKKVRTTSGSTFAQPNAPGGLRQVSDYEAWELGAMAAAEDDRSSAQTTESPPGPRCSHSTKSPTF